MDPNLFETLIKNNYNNPGSDEKQLHRAERSLIFGSQREPVNGKLGYEAVHLYSGGSISRHYADMRRAVLLPLPPPPTPSNSIPRPSPEGTKIDTHRSNHCALTACY
ncbi:unnamed protein product, partial [Iphiclides podalirius]